MSDTESNQSELSELSELSDEEYYSQAEDEESNIEPIQNINIRNSTYNIITIYHTFLKRQSIDLQPVYQRNISWSYDKMLLLLDSLYYLPIIPSFTLYKLSPDELLKIRAIDKETPITYECIDGQHRITVINSFMNSDPIRIGENDKYLYITAKDNKKTKLFYNITDAIKNKYKKNIRELDIDEKQIFEDTQLSFQIILSPISDIHKRNIFNRLQNGENVSSINKLKNIEHPITNYLRTNNIISINEFENWKHIIECTTNIYTRTGNNTYMTMLSYFIIKLIYITDKNSLDLNSRYNNSNLYKAIINNTESSQLDNNIDYIYEKINKNKPKISCALKEKKISCELYILLHYLILDNKENYLAYLPKLLKSTQQFKKFNTSIYKSTSKQPNTNMNAKYNELVKTLHIIKIK